MAEDARIGRGWTDPADAVGEVLKAKRDVLLRVHRHRLPHEDLEDCLSQAALELIGRARAGGLADERHVANALEQKFLSRVTDQQRALGGRSGIAAATRDAVRLGHADSDDEAAMDIAVSDAEPAHAVMGREDLQRLHEVAADLTDDQRLVLACQVSLGMDSAEFCERFGWSAEKFRKVAQRARARLRALIGEYEAGERCRRLEPDVVAYAARTASAPQALAVKRHLANCVGCAAYVRDLRLVSDRVAALLPVPVLAHAGLAAKAALFTKTALVAKVAALWRSLAGALGDAVGPAPTAGTGTAAGGAAVGLAKCGVAALCVAGVVGGGQLITPKGSEDPTPAGRPAVVIQAPEPRPMVAGSKPRATGAAARPTASRGPRPRRRANAAAHRAAPARRTTPRRSRPPAVVTAAAAASAREFEVETQPDVGARRPAPRPVAPPPPPKDEFGVE